MNVMQLILFILALINMIFISVLVYKRKYSIAIGLGLLELLIIFSSNLV
jgi:hypothetical protein